MSEATTLRSKHYLTTHSTVMAVAFGIAAVLGLVIFASAAAPAVLGDQTEQSTVHSVELDQSVSVLVTEDTTAYDAGTVLEGKTRYPIQNAEDPTVTVSTSGRNADVERLQLAVKYEAAPSNSPNEVFYSERRIIESTDGAGPIEATIPLPEIFDTIDALHEEFGSRTTVTATVVSTATYTHTNVNGEESPREQTITTTSQLDRLDRMYALPDDTSQAAVRSSTGGGGQPALLPGFIAAIMALISGTGAAVAVYADRNWDPQELERELERVRAEEWITAIGSYTPDGRFHTVTVSKLDDLVDLAIDTQNRVLYHTPVDEYIVIDGDSLYVYAPDGEEARTTHFGFSPDELAPVGGELSAGPAGGDELEFGEEPGIEGEQRS